MFGVSAECPSVCHDDVYVRFAVFAGRRPLLELEALSVACAGRRPSPEGPLLELPDAVGLCSTVVRESEFSELLAVVRGWRSASRNSLQGSMR